MMYRWLLTLTMAAVLMTAAADDGSQSLYSADAPIDRQKNDVPIAPDITLTCGDCVEWKVYRGQQSKFGLQMPKDLTLTQCQRACLQKTDCVGFDYDRSSLPCWLHLAVENFAVNSTYRVTKGDCDQYQLNRSCKTASTASLMCERAHETCIDGANYFKLSCLEQATIAHSKFNSYLEEDFVEKCLAACRGNEFCIKYCDTIKSNGFQVSGQQREQTVARCNADFNLHKVDCDRNFLTCI